MSLLWSTNTVNFR